MYVLCSNGGRQSCGLCPSFIFKNTLTIALEEITRSDDEVNQERGWKLFLMLPGMLLHRPPGGGLIPKAKLVQRFQSFAEGEWIRLIPASGPPA